MVRFDGLLKIKLTVIAIVCLNYSLLSYYFVLQGKAIDAALEKNNLPEQLIYTLAGFIFVKIIVMLLDIFQKFIIEYYKNIEMENQWAQHVPRKLYRESKNSKNDVSILFFEYLPRLFDAEITLTRNSTTVYFIFTLAILAFLYTGFLIGILALLLVFSLNFISKNIFTQKIDQYQTETNNSKIYILNWIDQYFCAFREISKNWPGIVNSNWKDRIYSSYFTSKNNQTVLYLRRDLFSQILVEFPFLLNTSVVILSVYYGHLSSTELFVWVGFSQFMISASNSYLENRVTKRQRDTLTTKTNDILSEFTSRESSKILTGSAILNSATEITLRDGTKNILSLKPGIYHIMGGNGSGKSTLLNILLDYAYEYECFENTNLSKLTSSINQAHTRVIERDVVVFECIDDINNQICGPVNRLDLHWEKEVRTAGHYLLGPALSKKWMDIFIAVVSDYSHRKDKTMSSGEKIILSILRFFASWNKEVNLLIIDECDSFLDSRKKALFIEAINALSAHMAVYICSHDASFIHPAILCPQPATIQHIHGHF